MLEEFETDETINSCLRYRFGHPQLEELLESHQAVLSNLTDSRVGSKT
jgi:hypothetical protein